MGLVDFNRWRSTTAKPYVDLRDWAQLDLTGANENNTVLSEAIAQAAYPEVQRVFIPTGKITFTEKQTLIQSSWLFGSGAVDGGSELWWAGADSVHAIDCIAECSYARMNDIRLLDKRVSPTAGDGIHIERGKNGIRFGQCFVGGFPNNQIYIGAPAGFTSDNIGIHQCWATSQVTGSVGLYLERLDNSLVVSEFYTDIDGGGAGISIGTITNDNCAISIRGVKHETGDGLTPTILVRNNSGGNTYIQNVMQRNFGAPNKPSPIIKFNDLTTRYLIANISGEAHANSASDWMAATADTIAPTIACYRDSGATLDRAFYDKILHAESDASGRITRGTIQVGDIHPQNNVNGYRGEVAQRTVFSGSVPVQYHKRSYDGQKQGWGEMDADPAP